MKKILGAVALVLALSIPADARWETAAIAQDNPQCGKCMELDNETLPDKHYFPPIDEFGGGGEASQLTAFSRQDGSAISANLWTSGSDHTGLDTVATPAAGDRTPGRQSDDKHGEPSQEPFGTKDSDWAWGGLKECFRGPEGRISAGCHATQYDNLLCNSHYDECDSELFKLAVNAVRSGNAVALRELMQQEKGSTVVLNRKRSAIQLVGCSGDIVGHLPISNALLRAIS